MTTVLRTSVVVTLAMVVLLVGSACKLGRSNEGLDSIKANVDGQLSPPGATAAGAPEARDPFDEPPRVTRVYASQLTRRQVIEFYARELGSRGWSVAVHESDQGMAWEKDGYLLSVGFGSARPGPEDMAKRVVVVLEEQE